MCVCVCVCVGGWGCRGVSGETHVHVSIAPHCACLYEFGSTSSLPPRLPASLPPILS